MGHETVNSRTIVHVMHNGEGEGGVAAAAVAAVVAGAMESSFGRHLDVRERERPKMPKDVDGTVIVLCTPSPNPADWPVGFEEVPARGNGDTPVPYARDAAATIGVIVLSDDEFMTTWATEEYASKISCEVLGDAAEQAAVAAYEHGHYRAAHPKEGSEEA